MNFSSLGHKFRYGPIAVSCKYGDEPVGPGTTELVSYGHKLKLKFKISRNFKLQSFELTRFYCSYLSVIMCET
jgi:hypothetical protein